MKYLLALALAGVLYPGAVLASDFVVLGVALGGLFIGAVNIALGIWAFICAKRKGYMEALPYLGIIVFLCFIGTGLIMDEADHMSDSDTTGLLFTVIAPAIVSFIAPLFVRTRRQADSTEDDCSNL